MQLLLEKRLGLGNLDVGKRLCREGEGFAGPASELVRRPHLQGWLESQLWARRQDRGRGRTSFWWALLQKKSEMPADSQSAHLDVVRTPQTSHGWASVSTGMKKYDSMAGAEEQARKAVRRVEDLGEEEERSSSPLHLRPSRPLALEPSLSFASLSSVPPSSTPRAPAPRPTPSLLAKPPHQPQCTRLVVVTA